MSAPGTPSLRPRPQFRSVEVRAIRRLSPRFVRITFAGEELAGFTDQWPAEHIKVLFPAEGEETPPLPIRGPEGLVYPEGLPRPSMRTYTPRRFDANALELDVDFLLHDAGPGSTWAAHAVPGRRVVIAGPGGGYPLEPEVSDYVIAGDESAIPAIATILETLPARARAQVFVEILDENEMIPLESDATIELTWLYRKDSPAVAGLLLDETLREVEWATEAHFFVACEATAMRLIRRYLHEERGVDRSALYTRGYWKYGAENHPDHDTGEDG